MLNGRETGPFIKQPTSTQVPPQAWPPPAPRTQAKLPASLNSILCDPSYTSSLISNNIDVVYGVLEVARRRLDRIKHSVLLSDKIRPRCEVTRNTAPKAAS